MKHILFVTMLLFFISAFGQPNESLIGKRVVIFMTNGNEFNGVLETDDGREILLITEDIGPVYINKAEIRRIRLVSSINQIVEGEFRDVGPFTTRYCFTTNALGINKGENYTMVNLYGPEVHLALTDRFSIGLMTTWFGSPLILATKYTIPTRNEKWNFSVGNLLATSGYLQNFRGYGNLLFEN
ncbi:MAG: hypothetical protein ACKO7B_04315, partial [Flavobacteriales bacterium]